MNNDKTTALKTSNNYDTFVIRVNNAVTAREKEFYLDQIIKNLPYYDGFNMQFSDYATEIKSAVEQVSESDYEKLMDAIWRRLYGKAKTSIENHGFEHHIQLLETLSYYFDNFKLGGPFTAIEPNDRAHNKHTHLVYAGLEVYDKDLYEDYNKDDEYAMISDPYRQSKETRDLLKLQGTALGLITAYLTQSFGRKQTNTDCLDDSREISFPHSDKLEQIGPVLTNDRSDSLVDKEEKCSNGPKLANQGNSTELKYNNQNIKREREILYTSLMPKFSTNSTHTAAVENSQLNSEKGTQNITLNIYQNQIEAINPFKDQIQSSNELEIEKVTDEIIANQHETQPCNLQIQHLDKIHNINTNTLVMQIENDAEISINKKLSDEMAVDVNIEKSMRATFKNEIIKSSTHSNMEKTNNQNTHSKLIKSQSLLQIPVIHKVIFNEAKTYSLLKGSILKKAMKIESPKGLIKIEYYTYIHNMNQNTQKPKSKRKFKERMFRKLTKKKRYQIISSWRQNYNKALGRCCLISTRDYILYNFRYRRKSE